MYIELRDACARNGIISTEPHSSDEQDSNEHNHQANHLNIVEDATVAINGNQVPPEEQQLAD